MADQNPYMNERSGGRRGAHFAPSAAPMITYDQEPPRRKRRKWPIVLLLVALLAGGIFGAYKLGIKPPRLSDLPGVSSVLQRLGLRSKDVTITLNGTEAKVPEGSTVQDVFDAQAPAVEPGDLLSVSGAMLEVGKGDAYNAVLNEQQVAMADAASTVVPEGATLDYYNGQDVTEDFTSETVLGEAPKLVRQVKEGVEENDAVQTGTIQYVYQWGKQGSKEVRTGSISGEKADVNVVETQDCIIMCQDIHPDNNQKLVALTFDDGPFAYTPQVLDVLAQNDVKATFNLIGEQVEEGAESVRAAVAAGHQITSHTWNHPDLPAIDAGAVRSQLTDSFDVIKRVADYDTSTIRAPYGSITFDVWLHSGGAMSLSCYWTHDSEDWKTPGTETIVSNCTANMAPGSVILLHDGGGDRTQTVEALPRIIQAWKDAGYTFVTMEELMKSDSSIPAECTANYRPMPADAVWPTQKADQPAAKTVD